MQGPILEIGSKRYGGPPTFFAYRTLFPYGTPYIGVDMEPCDGVDAVIDMTSDIGSIGERLGGLRFNSLICLSVLEHVNNIAAFANNDEPHCAVSRSELHAHLNPEKHVQTSAN
jgi:hypothetical protein